MVISAALAVISYGSKSFDYGVRVLDWLGRYETVRDRRSPILGILRWLFSPHGADLIFLLAIAAFFVAVILTVNSKEEEEASDGLPTPPSPSTAQALEDVAPVPSPVAVPLSPQQKLEQWRMEAWKNHHLVFELGKGLSVAGVETDAETQRVVIVTDFRIRFEKKPEPKSIKAKRLIVELCRERGIDDPQIFGIGVKEYRVVTDEDFEDFRATRNELVNRPEGDKLRFDGMEFTQHLSPFYRFIIRTFVYGSSKKEILNDRFNDNKHFLKLTLEASDQEPLSMELAVDWPLFHPKSPVEIR